MMKTTIALLLTLGACVDDTVEARDVGIGEYVVARCGEPPAATETDYHYWASFFEKDNVRYALLYDRNWQSMIVRADAEQAWRDCVVGLD